MDFEGWFELTRWHAGPEGPSIVEWECRAWRGLDLLILYPDLGRLVDEDWDGSYAYRESPQRVRIKMRAQKAAGRDR